MSGSQWCVVQKITASIEVGFNICLAFFSEPYVILLISTCFLQEQYIQDGNVFFHFDYGPFES